MFFRKPRLIRNHVSIAIEGALCNRVNCPTFHLIVYNTQTHTHLHTQLLPEILPDLVPNDVNMRLTVTRPRGIRNSVQVAQRLQSLPSLSIVSRLSVDNACSWRLYLLFR